MLNLPRFVIAAATLNADVDGKANRYAVQPYDVAKFVRGAMLVFPELYFARFVILVEGNSERVVLPRLAEAEGIILDPSFVAVVPLGGRHVQHFWRLLNGLAEFHMPRCSI